MTLASNMAKAAESLAPLIVGPSPSRTNPTGTSKGVVNPRDALARRLDSVAGFALQSVRSLTPMDTGETRDSFTVRRLPDASIRGAFEFGRFQVVSNLPDDQQVRVNTLEYGSRPHIIRPKLGVTDAKIVIGAKFMRIPLDAADVGAFATMQRGHLPGTKGRGSGGFAFIKQEPGGTFLYTTQVSHPGTKPYAMFRKTLDAIGPVASRIATDVIAEVGASFATAETKP